MPGRLTDEQLQHYQDGITEQKLFLDRDVEPLVTELLELRKENKRLKGGWHWPKKMRELEREVERLHSWAGLMELLDEHWPEDIFPTLEDDIDRDTGPRLVSLLRWVERLRKRCEDQEQFLKENVEDWDVARPTD